MKELSEKEYAKAMLKTIKWEKYDVKKKNMHQLHHWNLAVLYNRYMKEYFMAEVFFTKKNKPILWGKLDFSGDNIEELQVQAYQIIEHLRTTYPIYEVDKKGDWV
jgi:hypothetical protein